MRRFPIKTWKDGVLLLILAAVGVGFYFFLTRTEGPRLNLPDVGAVAPDFTLPTLNGSSVRLSEYRGKIVFVNFWATWCPPCVWEMPSMEALYQRLKGRGFEILAVSIDKQGEAVVRPFVARHGLTFPVLLDPDSATYRLYGLTGLPETFVIDRNGVILLKMVGPQEWTQPKWLDYFDKATKEE
jgi:peroxiredoxin